MSLKLFIRAQTEDYWSRPRSAEGDPFTFNEISCPPVTLPVSQIPVNVTPLPHLIGVVLLLLFDVLRQYRFETL